MSNELNDTELKKVAGGSEDGGLSPGGGVCPIDGKYCEHGQVNLLGRCFFAETQEKLTASPDGDGVVTFYTCRYPGERK